MWGWIYRRTPLGRKTDGMEQQQQERVPAPEIRHLLDKAHYDYEEVAAALWKEYQQYLEQERYLARLIRHNAFQRYLLDRWKFG
jgi:hypothetical protein